MKFRRFTDEGLTRFRDYLERLSHEDPKLDPPVELLTDTRWSEPLKSAIEAEPQPFARRMDFACWLHDASVKANTPIPRTDPHFWAWLSLSLFDQVAPVLTRIRYKSTFQGKKGRFIGDMSRHIPELDNFQRSYRHLLAGPYSVYLVHVETDPNIALAALINPLHEPGDLSEQLGGSRLHALCPGTMALATRLFVDVEKMKPRAKVSTASKRLGKLMNQYTRTFDLPEMNPRVFASMLPKEFKTFVNMAEDAEAAAAP